MNAHKNNTKDGYVVVWQEGYNVIPLRCFGNYQSAAIEFCNILNSSFWEKKQSQIQMWAKTYNPAVKYSYPKLTGTGVQLKKQKL